MLFGALAATTWIVLSGYQVVFGFLGEGDPQAEAAKALYGILLVAAVILAIAAVLIPGTRTAFFWGCTIYAGLFLGGFLLVLQYQHTTDWFGLSSDLSIILTTLSILYFVVAGIIVATRPDTLPKVAKTSSAIVVVFAIAQAIPAAGALIEYW